MRQSASVRGWPLAGREAELDVVTRSLVSEGRGVVIVAPPGTGKTALVHAVVRRVAPDLETVQIAGTESARGLPLAAVTALLPEDLPDGSAPLAVFRAVHRRFANRPSSGRALLVVDDAHLLDPLSAALVHHLSVAGATRVLAAVRAGEVVEDAITALWRDGIADRLDLEPLGPADVATVLVEVLDGPVEEATSWRLWRLTGGNPLSLRELVAAIRADGRLHSDDGVWRWQGDVAIGTRLRELVGQRLEHLDDAERRVVELLGVGEVVDRVAVERECGSAPLARLELRGYVVEAAELAGAVRLDHPLFGEVVRMAMAPSERASWCRVLAASTPVVPGDDGALLRRVTWQLDGGIDVDAAVLIHASERATRRFDGALGARIADAALRAGGGAHARLARAEAHYWAGRPLAALEDIEALDATELADPLLARVAMIRAEAGFWGLGRVEETDRALDALAALIRDPAAAQRIVALRSAMLVAAGDLGRAAQLASPIASDPSADDQARLRAVTAAAAGLIASGDPEAGLALCHDLLPVALEHVAELPRGVGWVLAQWINALACLGRLDEVHELLLPIRAQAIADGDHEAVLASGLVLGKLALLRGDLAAAAEQLREAEAGLRELDPSGYRPWCLGVLAQVAGQRGDAAGARRAVDRIDAAEWLVHAQDHDVVIGRAWAHAATGEIGVPVGMLVDAADVECERGRPTVAAQYLYEALRIGADATVVADRLAAAVEGHQLPLHRRYLDQAQALAASDGARLEAIAGEMERTGLLLYAAECAAQSAVTFRTAGLRSAAARAAGLADRLRRRCPDARTRALVDVPGLAGPGLTRRELEVVRLASDGHSNVAIAEQLGIGVRTVEGHLLRACGKLGVRSRRDLARALGSAENA